MSAEVIDIIVISVVLLFTLIFVLIKIKKALFDDGGNKCSGCSEKSCSPGEKKDCQTVDVFK